MKIVLASGGFDPLHSGHIQYLQAARQLGDRLYVAVNSDEWLIRKKSKFFLPQLERLKIVQSLKMVDYSLKFDDSDDSAKNALHQVRQLHPDDEIIFANGGDRTAENIPEMELAHDQRFANLRFEFGVGGHTKVNSSSEILRNWTSNSVDRPWGKYRVLSYYEQYLKCKELIVEPGQKLSMQRHQNRAEFWFVAQGQATVYTLNRSTDIEVKDVITQFQNIWIAKSEWHQLVNETDQPLYIIEIQYGSECNEDDIERRQTS
jgi:D-beta-D-heptose 7-phosphate kinase/D-beta-D-heptose 1-phosphate adenosyltransferase